MVDSPTPFDIGKESRPPIIELGGVGHETFGGLIGIIHAAATIDRLVHVDCVVVRVDVLVVGDGAAPSTILLLLPLLLRVRWCRWIHDGCLVGVCAVAEALVVHIDLSACVDIACASLAARGPRAIARARLHNCLIRETLRPMLVELHEDRLECRLDDKWHQEEKRKEAERAEEDEESGCVEKLKGV